MPIIFFNGKYVPLAEAKISVLDRGFLYGDGVFESLRTYSRAPFLLKAHLRRLLTGAKRLKIRPPYSAVQLKAAVEKLIYLNQFPETYLKIIITRGEAKGHGLNFSNSTGKPNVIILAEPANEKEISDWKVTIATIRRADLPTAHLKSLCYLDNALAKEEASHAGYNEAIMLDKNDCVAEGTVSNIFIIKNGIIYTPPTKEPILVGITRQYVIRLARKDGIKVQEKCFPVTELFKVDECFATMSGAGIIPITRIGKKTIGNGKTGLLTKRLMAKYQAATAV